MKAASLLAEARGLIGSHEEVVNLGSRTWAAIGVMLSIMESVDSHQPMQAKNIQEFMCISRISILRAPDCCASDSFTVW